ncbi:acyltransferase family protein [Kitasatospora sp. McL0602]|uniref:acyltransferase family protein n=1 Tax=Kitasatospora sp. McL0602 TaxID=3439530 RepID=UPI003F888807
MRGVRGGARGVGGTVGSLLSGRDNSLGALRLGMAAAVMVSHSTVLGYGTKDVGLGFSHGQTAIGTIAVYGFFVLSGVLVTRSGARLGLGRFLWHRALRLLPGFWVCLLVTAFVVAPGLYLARHGTTAGFWHHPAGPVAYLRADWALDMSQWDVSGVMADAGRAHRAHNGSFDGSLWSLRFEVLCYFAVALLGATGVLTRARRAVAVVTVALGWLVITDALPHRYGSGVYSTALQGTQERPLTGSFAVAWVLYLGFAFALGATIEIYRDSVPVDGALAALSAAVLVCGLHFGYFYVVGLPALAYLLVWLAIRLPAPLRRIGRTHDYSYGVYIYGFVVQQALAVAGWTRWGLPVYLALAVIGTGVAAALSWHVVERPAMRLKDLDPYPLLRPGVRLAGVRLAQAAGGGK